MDANRELRDLIYERAFLGNFRRLARICGLMATGLIVLIGRRLNSMTFDRFRMAYALDRYAVGYACLTARALARVFRTNAGRRATFERDELDTAVGGLRRRLARHYISDVTGRVNVRYFRSNLTQRSFEDRNYQIDRAKAASDLGRTFLSSAFLGIRNRLTNALLKDAPASAIDRA